MYGATPHFEEGLEHMLKTQHKQIFVIPYLLFQGILMNEISERIECIEDEEKERSEERRVGKEWRSRGGREQEKKKKREEGKGEGRENDEEKGRRQET